MSAPRGAQDPIVVVGAGHAGVQFANALRAAGSTRRIVLISQESELPYEKPPLSKMFLDGTRDADGLRFHAAEHYETHDIDLRLGVKVLEIDPVDDVLHLADGTVQDFGTLVLATGGTPRRLPVRGAGFEGVVSLATRADADRLRRLLARARHPVLVGAGFIGLEVAAAAAALRPVVVDVAERVLARVSSAAVSGHVVAVHTASGVRFELNAAVSELRGTGGRVESVVLADGRELPADLVVVGVGMVPNDRLAAGAGIAVADGVLVDRQLATSRARVYAIGDCARFETGAGASLRLESVQNAADQARRLVRILGGDRVGPDQVPWFWSHQGALKLQIAGLPVPADRHVLRGAPDVGRFSLFWYADGNLAYVESVNHAAGHMLGRRLLAEGCSPPPELLADPGLDAKALLARAAAAEATVS
ncbi:NAD(P)/FAD-dependent oxidoreductase [Streptomyces sp. NPDC059255]|uniref:NAD(P)/FAD-dependent oxidoreductase n=1 Tax=Streptomyces sp. NPDC059255 TaxID=3346793 RepID=UPI0036A66B3C